MNLRVLSININFFKLLNIFLRSKGLSIQVVKKSCIYYIQCNISLYRSKIGDGFFGGDNSTRLRTHFSIERHAAAMGYIKCNYTTCQINKQTVADKYRWKALAEEIIND